MHMSSFNFTVAQFYKIRWNFFGFDFGEAKYNQNKKKTKQQQKQHQNKERYKREFDGTFANIKHPLGESKNCMPKQQK